MSRNFDHTISGNKGSTRPRYIIFADVESRLSLQPDGRTLFTPFLWTMITDYYRKSENTHKQVEYWGDSVTAFWDKVEAFTYKRNKTYLVTHHLEVDFMPLKGFIELQARGWQLEKLISHNRVLILFWQKGTSKLIIMNNGNLFDGSIADWGTILGIEKLEMPGDNASLEAWHTYCMRDTVILAKMWELLYNFIDEHDLGNFKMTKASLAITAYRHRFMPLEISIHNDPLTVALERESYKGGRFEALQIGHFDGDKFYNLDINSMYGFIEQTAFLPYELRGYLPAATFRQLNDRLKKYAVLAEVDLETNLPVFPHKVDNKITYTPGSFRTVLTTPEIVYSLAHGWIKSLYRMAWYYQARILEEFADFFLELKDRYDKEGNKPMRQMSKLYLNSLYGKFAQHGYEDSIIGECDPEEFKFIDCMSFPSHIRHTEAHYGGKIHVSKVTDLGYATFISIASHITAFGRLALWQLIQAAGLENTYHVATDSLIVNQAGFDRLSNYIDPHTPGKLKLENTFDQITIKDVNDTVQGFTIKIKGIPKNAVKLTENSYSITEWPRLLTLLKHGITDHYYTRQSTKTLSRPKYYKGLGIANPDLAAAAKKHVQRCRLAAYDDRSRLDILAQIEALRDARLIRAVDMLKLWDYKKGTFRMQRTLQGKLREIQFSDAHWIAWEYGYPEIDDLMTAVEAQVNMDLRTRQLKSDLRRSGHGSYAAKPDSIYPSWQTADQAVIEF